MPSNLNTISKKASKHLVNLAVLSVEKPSVKVFVLTDIA